MTNQHWLPQLEEIQQAASEVDESAGLGMNTRITAAVSHVSSAAVGEARYGDQMSLKHLTYLMTQHLRNGWATEVARYRPDAHQQRRFDLALLKIQQTLTPETMFPTSKRD